FITCGIMWLIVALGSGYSSLGAVVAFCFMPILGFCIAVNVGWAFLAIGALCLWRHRGNIGRLISGTESKIEWKWKK
ncbi:glycerol-3-phosphate acyltransferase, partial [bacterium]|nr:glycerol-3-phosphate acyltransferase [bacterium]